MATDPLNPLSNVSYFDNSQTATSNVNSSLSNLDSSKQIQTLSDSIQFQPIEIQRERYDTGKPRRIVIRGNITNE